MERADVLVVGGGSAGLSVSHELARGGIEHLVLERGRVGQAWRDRWDSFCLVTPNWSVRLPGGEYRGDDPDGFLPRDEIAAHLEGYARAFDAPVRSGVEVLSVVTTPGGFTARTTAGDIAARAIVAGTGAFGRPHRPPEAASLPPRLAAIDLGAYRNPYGPAAGSRAGHRERPIGLPACRGAARGRP